MQNYIKAFRELPTCTNREEAKKLAEGIGNKGLLMHFCREHKINATIQDNKAAIIEKIVEFFVGANLRTEAIKTLNMN